MDGAAFRNTDQYCEQTETKDRCYAQVETKVKNKGRICCKWNYQESEKAIQRMEQIFVNHVSAKGLDSKNKEYLLTTI